MPTIQETAYPRLRNNVTPKELAAIYTPTPEELALAQQFTANGSATRLGFLVLLKTFQRLGYATSIQAVPTRITQHIAAVSHLSSVLGDLDSYDDSATRKRHLVLIREYLQLHPHRQAATAVMMEALRQSALTKQDLADLMNVAIEELVRQRFELPAFSTLKRAAQNARAQVMATFHQQVNRGLTPESRQQIDALLMIAPPATTSIWHDLKQDSGRLTLPHLHTWINRLHQLNELQFGAIALKGIPEVKIKHFAEEALTLDAARMKQMEPSKRYTLSVALLKVQKARTLDDLAEMLIKQMQQMHHKGKTALAELRVQTQPRTDELIATLRDLVLAYQQEGDTQERFTAIETVIGSQGDTIVEQCEAHLSHAGNNHFSLIQDFYKSRRASLFRLLEVLPIRSSTQDTTLESVIQFLLEHRYSRLSHLPMTVLEYPKTLAEKRVQRLDLSWIPPKWWVLVTQQRARLPYPNVVQRRHFEVCVFSQIFMELKSGDLYIEGSSEYGDYYAQLISWAEYEAAIGEYGQQVELPTAPTAFVSYVQQWLTDCATALDQAFPTNVDVDYQRNRLVIRKPQSKTVAGAAPLKAQIAARIRPVNLIDSWPIQI